MQVFSGTLQITSSREPPACFSLSVWGSGAGSTNGWGAGQLLMGGPCSVLLLRWLWRGLRSLSMPWLSHQLHFLQLRKQDVSTCPGHSLPPMSACSCNPMLCSARNSRERGHCTRVCLVCGECKYAWHMMGCVCEREVGCVWRW